MLGNITRHMSRFIDIKKLKRQEVSLCVMTAIGGGRSVIPGICGGAVGELIARGMIIVEQPAPQGAPGPSSSDLKDQCEV